MFFVLLSRFVVPESGNYRRTYNLSINSMYILLDIDKEKINILTIMALLKVEVKTYHVYMYHRFKNRGSTHEVTLVYDPESVKS